MTQEKLIDAITALDSDILERYFTMKAELAEKKKPKKRHWVKWAGNTPSSTTILKYLI